jgi:tRNA threonylcarbamoyladenosine biosynthesis protein TsaE
MRTSRAFGVSNYCFRYHKRLASGLFSGEMGAGKTSLIKELGKQMDIVNNPFKVPTFSLVNSYANESRKNPFYHFSIYMD